MATYDKPTWQLIEYALNDLPEIFTTDEVLGWFRSRYPKLKDGTVRAHLSGMSVNNPTRRHYSGLLAHGLLYKVDRYHYTRYDPERHGTFDKLGRQAEVADEEEALAEEGLAGYESTEPSPEQSEFALERHLEEFMERNWSRIDFGQPLDIWEDEDGIRGRQYPTEVGYIDFLCRDRTSGSFVVVELKKGKTTDAVVGQCQRYMGWVKRNLDTEGRPVHGLIVASDLDSRLKYALEVTPHISLRLYRVNFELVSPEEPSV